MEQKDQRQAAANYVTQFYAEVTALTQNASLYNFYLLRIGSNGSKESSNKGLPLEEKDQEEVKNLLSYIHTDIYKIALRVKMIAADLKKEELKVCVEKIKEAHEKIKASYMVKNDDLAEFVESCHSFLVLGTMNDILLNSQEIINQLLEAGRSTRV